MEPEPAVAVALDHGQPDHQLAGREPTPAERGDHVVVELVQHRGHGQRAEALRAERGQYLLPEVLGSGCLSDPELQVGQGRQAGEWVDGLIGSLA